MKRYSPSAGLRPHPRLSLVEASPAECDQVDSPEWGSAPGTTIVSDRNKVANSTTGIAVGAERTPDAVDGVNSTHLQLSRTQLQRLHLSVDPRSQTIASYTAATG